MVWRRVVAISAASIVLLAAGCGGDAPDDASVAGSSAADPAEPADPSEPAGPCPGTEVGALPLTVEVPEEAPYVDGLEPTVLGVAIGPDGVVYFNLPFGVYCVADDTLFELASPETVPYPEGDEESSYADIAVSPDGNPLVADWQNPRVFELEDGELTVVPGSDDPVIGGSRSIEAAPDGTIYVTGLDQSGSTGVYAIADGEATIYAGPGEFGIAGDGGPATESYLDEPEGLHLDDDGSLYIADRNNSRVAVVAPDGTIDTFAGGKFFDDRPDSDALDGPSDVAIDPDGVVHVLDDEDLYRIEDDGSSTLLSGESSDCYLDIATTPPTQCDLNEYDLASHRIAFDDAGTLWISDIYQLLRVVDGRIEIAVEFELTSE